MSKKGEQRTKQREAPDHAAERQPASAGQPAMKAQAPKARAAAKSQTSAKGPATTKGPVATKRQPASNVQTTFKGQALPSGQGATTGKAGAKGKSLAKALTSAKDDPFAKRLPLTAEDEPPPPLKQRQIAAIRKLALDIAEQNMGPGTVLICNRTTEPSALPKRELLYDSCGWCGEDIYYDRKMPSPPDIVRVCVACGILLLEAEKKGAN